MTNKNKLKILTGEEFAGKSDEPCYPELAKYETKIHSHPYGITPQPTNRKNPQRVIYYGKTALDNMIDTLKQIN